MKKIIFIILPFVHYALYSGKKPDNIVKNNDNEEKIISSYTQNSVIESIVEFMNLTPECHLSTRNLSIFKSLSGMNHPTQTSLDNDNHSIVGKKKNVLKKIKKKK
jgi:hypothetical protein